MDQQAERGGHAPRGAELSRRAVLRGALLTALAASGCTPGPPAAPTAPTAPTVASLTATTPYYIAHRGGGGDWPEMTAYAYAQATRLPGLHALEVSVCLSSDGVLVCSHDPTTERLCGVGSAIADQTWAELSTLQVSARETVDPRQPARPFTRFDEVLDAYADRYVLFVEPKVGPAAAPLMARLASLSAPQRVVWKQPVNSRRFVEAKQHGFATWGYVLDEPAHLGDNLSRYAAAEEIDRLGVPAGGSDALIASVVQAAVQAGKQTIAWPLSTAAGRDRVLGLGVVGLMTSRIAELLPTT